MPKTQPLGSDGMKKKAHMDQFMAKEDAEYTRISTELRMLKVKLHMQHHEIAALLGLNMRTWQKRIVEPDSLRLFEIRRIQELAKIYGVEVTL